MKHIELFENLQLDANLKKTINDYSELVKLCKEYLNLHKDELDNQLEVTEIKDIWFPNNKYFPKNVFPKRPIFSINYETSDNDLNTYSLDKEKYDDFLLFLDDPELYKSVKKYNL
jgi:hypothetical protein